MVREPLPGQVLFSVGARATVSVYINIAAYWRPGADTDQEDGERREVVAAAGGVVRRGVDQEAPS